MATTTERANRVSTTQVGRSPQRWIPWAAGAVAVAVVAVAGTAVWSGRQAVPEAVPVQAELLRQQAMTDIELRQELIEKGLIPMPTVAASPELLRQQAMSDAELRQELIGRGLIPGSVGAVSPELLRQQAMTDTELRQELFERGLVPTGTAVPVSSELLRQQAMTDAELRQELIERGLIPGSAVPQATSGADVPRGITPSSTDVREAP